MSTPWPEPPSAAPAVASAAAAPRAVDLLRTGRLGTLALLSILAIALIAGALGLLIAAQSHRVAQARAWVAHTDQVLLSEAELGSALGDAERGQRGYLITGHRAYLDPYQHALQVIPGLQARLVELTADNPPQQARIRQLNALVNARLAQLAQVLVLYDARGAEAAAGSVDRGEGLRLMSRIGAETEAIGTHERQLLGERLAQSQRQQSLASLLVLVGTVVLIVLLIAVAWLVRHAQLALRHQAEQLAGLVGELQLEGRRKDDFLATLAHELRNPLAPIRSAADMLRREHLSPALIARASEVIRRQVRHVTRLLDDLLTLTRLTHAKLRLHLAAVPARECLETAIEMAEPALSARQQRIEAVLPPPTLQLVADGPRLAQVIANLLLNASKFSDVQQTVHLSAQQVGRELEIVIRDPGIGIEPQDLARVFDRFYQIGASGGRDYAGLGIGLALAKELIEMHGGHIALTSPGAGRGTTATVRLPMSPSAQPGNTLAEIDRRQPLLRG
jgi:signal transduction histidine kinase